MRKFANDAYLVIPALNSHTRDDELMHVKLWAAANNLHFNCAKSHKIVLGPCRLQGKAKQLAPPCPDIELVDKLAVLGIDVNSSLLASCSSQLYALRVLS